MRTSPVTALVTRWRKTEVSEIALLNFARALAWELSIHTLGSQTVTAFTSESHIQAGPCGTVTVTAGSVLCYSGNKLQV
jgi:hypothetical protein